MEKLDGKKFINQAEALYEQALTETKELLKNNPNGAFIAIPDYEDVILSMNSNDLGLEIWAVGVNEKDHICIKAYEDQPYDCSVLEWYGLQWIDIEDGDIHYEIDKRSILTSTDSWLEILMLRPLKKKPTRLHLILTNDCLKPVFCYFFRARRRCHQHGGQQRIVGLLC